MAQKKRKQMFVDAKVQGALILRTVIYWLFCLAAITLMVLCWRIVTGPARIFYTHFEEMWFYFGPAAIASLLLLPIVVTDVVQLSNRFAGPMLRLRRNMRRLAEGEHVDPINFREGDFWRDFADDFNAIVARVQEGKKLPNQQPARKFDESEELAGA